MASHDAAHLIDLGEDHPVIRRIHAWNEAITTNDSDAIAEFITDDWVCIGSTNLNHRSFLHDLEMDVVITRDENKLQIIQGYLRDQEKSQSFDTSGWAHLPLWKRVLSSAFLLLKYWS